MLKLYTAPGACSLACDIALEEAGIPFERKIIQFDEGYLDSPAYLKINPSAAVPSLELEPGTVLTEGVAILQYIAAQKPEKTLFPTTNQGMEYYRAVEWMNFIATELHTKTFGSLFGAAMMVPDAAAQATFQTTIRGLLADKLAIADRKLEGKSFCVGGRYTVADAYLFAILNWSRFHQVDLAPYKNLTTFQNRIFERPATQRAMKAVGLLQ